MACRSAIAGRLATGLFDDGDPDAPLDRKTTIRLARAVAAAEVATRGSAASGTLAPYQERTREGVSANLCEALAELLEAARADSLRATFSFAHRRPVSRDVPRSVVLPADMAPTLRSAATALREVGVLSSHELLGTVVVLESEDAAAGGAIQMNALVEGRSMRVRMSLPPAEYTLAMEAHRRRALVRCAGDLLREGRARVLQNPRDFVLSGEEEG